MSLAFFNNLDEVAHGIDHAANARRVFERAGTADFAQTESTQRRSLDIRLAICATDLAHRQRLTGFLFNHDICPYEAAACSPFWPSRRAMISVTLRPRRWATMRGLCWFLNPSKIARTML